MSPLPVLTFACVLCGTLALIASDGAHGPVANSSAAPAFCRNLDCPRFAVLDSFANITLRHYEPSVWVSIRRAYMEYTDAKRFEMFQKLFHYISGNNSANMKIPMTSPVLTEIVHGLGPDCESNFTMNFMMPFHLQANPPMPTESEVFISRKPALDVYVKSFGGFASETDNRDNVIALAQLLDDNHRQYRDDVFYTAGYDGPYAFTGRHNEVWVQSKP